MSALVEVIRDVFGISNDSDVVAAGLREKNRDVVGQIRAASATNVDANVRRQWLAHSSFVLDLSRLRPFYPRWTRRHRFRFFLCQNLSSNAFCATTKLSLLLI